MHNSENPKLQPETREIVGEAEKKNAEPRRIQLIKPVIEKFEKKQTNCPATHTHC